MALVCEYHGELELDLAEKNIDLLDMWRGRLSYRRLALAISDLDSQSRLVKADDPDWAKANSWDNTHYLLALLADLIGKANFQKWQPIPRPHEEIEARCKAEARRQRLIQRTMAKIANQAE